MATNKHAIIRYQTLNRCFRNPGKKYFIEDLIEACNNSLNEFTGLDTSVQKRQVYEDIKFMESDQGWNIELKKLKLGRKVFYKYENVSFSINQKLLNDYEAAQLKETLLTLNKFKGLPQFKWVHEMITRLESSFNLKDSESPIIEFDQNPFLIGLDFIGPLFYAISEKRNLFIKYKGVKMESEREYDFSPHYLKQYNSRWFLFGLINDKTTLTNFALDRIISINNSSSNYNINRTQYKEYFEDVIGVTVFEKPIQNIKLQVRKSILPYIVSKPLHGSQKVSKLNDEIFIELNLIPNYELESLILSYGESIKIIEPEAFKTKIKTRIKKMFEETF